MILRRVELGQFGKWTGQTFEFRRGANLVIGGNEAGKTTLAEAIRAVLFGAHDKERFVPWAGAGGCVAALVWENRQHFWRIERDIRTDEVDLTIWDEKGTVLRHFSGPAEVGEPRGEYGELLRELCGLSGTEPFTTAALGLPDVNAPFPFSQVGQDKLQRELGSERTESELQAVRRHLARLEKRWYELRPITGQLQDVVQQLEEIQQELSAAADAPASTKPAKAEPPVLQAENSCPAWVQAGVGSRFQRRQQLLEELARLGLPAAMPPDLPLLLAEAEALRRELVSLQKESVGIRERRATRPAPPWKMAAIVSVLPLLFAIAGSLWLQWGGAGWLAGALLAALVWLVNGHFHGLHLAEDARLKGQAQAIEARREGAQEMLSLLDDRFRELNISPSAVSQVKMQKCIVRGRVIADELRQLDGALSVLQEMTDGVLEQGLTAESLAPTGMASLPHSAETEELLERHRQLMQEQDRLQTLLRERQQIEEEGARLRDQEALLARQLKEHAAVVVPADGGEGRHFIEECARLLALWGGRRAWQVAATEHGSLVLKEGEGGWHPPFAYGHGACDLLGVAVRLASEQACQLPLLLDEALVHLERARQAEVFGSLERIAGQRQVIVFCREDQLPKRLARERWQVVSLDEEPIRKERDDHAGQLHLL